MSLGALGDSYYEYLLKAWLQSGQTDEEARDMYDEAMLAIMDKMVRTSTNGLTYVSDLKFDRLEHKMDHLACFSGEFRSRLIHRLYLIHLWFVSLSLRWPLCSGRRNAPERAH